MKPLQMHTHNSCRTPPRTHGFTLIELMIVVAIVAIIMAIAYPSYQNHVLKTARTNATACMMEHAQFMERFYTSNLTYEAADANLGCANDADLANRYQIGIDGLGQATYTITATPHGPQLKDTVCGTLSLNQAGTRSVSGSGTAGQCW